MAKYHVSFTSFHDNGSQLWGSINVTLAGPPNPRRIANIKAKVAESRLGVKPRTVLILNMIRMYDDTSVNISADDIEALKAYADRSGLGPDFEAGLARLIETVKG